MSPESNAPGQTTVLDDVLTRLAQITLTERYESGRIKADDDTVLGTATDQIKRLHLAMNEVSTEIQPFMDQSRAISERIEALLPKNIRTMKEMNDAVMSNETTRSLHEENMSIATRLNPLNELLAVLRNLVAAEVLRAIPESRHHQSYGSVQMTSDWEIVYLSDKAVYEMRMQSMPNALTSEDGVHVVIMRGGAPSPESESGPDKKRMH